MTNETSKPASPAEKPSPAERTSADQTAEFRTAPPAGRDRSAEDAEGPRTESSSVESAVPSSGTAATPPVPAPERGPAEPDGDSAATARGPTAVAKSGRLPNAADTSDSPPAVSASLPPAPSPETPDAMPLGASAPAPTAPERWLDAEEPKSRPDTGVVAASPGEKPVWWEPDQVVEPELVPPESPADGEMATTLPPADEAEAAPAAQVEPEPRHTSSQPSLYIVHVTPELAPAAKVGGLADVVFGLGKELEIRGHHVEFILPKYDCLRYDHVWGLTETYSDLWVPWYGAAIHCAVYFGFVHGRKCFFIEPHSADNFFNRGGIYGFHDDILRFAFFSRAALEFMWKSGKHPEIIHCHDWQTALVPVFLFEIYQHLGMTHPRVCFTIHNFKHQGVTGANLLAATGLNRPEYYFHYDRLRDNHNAHALNLMKGGVVYANFVTTVSPRHAIEAKDQGEGFGLEPTLHIHHQKYGGVVNGIDYDVWNPELDRYIPFRYSIDTLDDKYKNKIALRDRLLLADNEKPIVAFIGRLDPQKGLELLRHAIFYTLHRKGQFVLLGSSPDSQINSYFWGLKHQLNENPDCHIEIGFNEELSHLIYSGADIVLVPSRFEPCGLTQLIALRYGTVPVVRKVGGLADTVFDKDHSHRPLHERNGYVFRDYDFGGVESALGRAISCYYDYPEHFRELMKNGMRYDYSWKHPGQDYLNIYEYVRDK